MDAEWWKREGIELHSIYAPDLWVWFRRLVGTDQTTEYESSASNLLALNPGIVCGYPEPSPVWVLREQNVGVIGDGSKKHIDVIIVTPTDVWVVEVKYPRSTHSIRNTGDETYEAIIENLVVYRKRIEELGWWSGRTKRLWVVWVYDDEAKYKSLAEERRLDIGRAIKSISSFHQCVLAQHRGVPVAVLGIETRIGCFCPLLGI